MHSIKLEGVGKQGWFLCVPRALLLSTAVRSMLIRCRYIYTAYMHRCCPVEVLCCWLETCMYAYMLPRSCTASYKTSKERSQCPWGCVCAVKCGIRPQSFCRGEGGIFFVTITSSFVQNVILVSGILGFWCKAIFQDLQVFSLLVVRRTCLTVVFPTHVLCLVLVHPRYARTILALCPMWNLSCVPSTAARWGMSLLACLPLFTFHNIHLIFLMHALRVELLY